MLGSLEETLIAALPSEVSLEDRKAFIERVLEDYRPGELPQVEAADLAAVLADFWRYGAEWNAGAAAQVRLRPAQGRDGRSLDADLLEIVQADAPFLVDSVMGELGEVGIVVRAMFHPLAGGEHRSRSMIQVWLEPMPEARRASVVEAVRFAMADVAVAVGDFHPMSALLGRSIAGLERQAPAQDAWSEEIAFLHWLEAGHFVYLGARIYDYPRTANGEYAAEEPLYQSEESLGVLRDATRLVLRRGNEPAILSAALRRGLETGDPVIVAKSNLRSRVHRRVYMDYIGVRRFGDGGRPTGEVRFVGLFTAQAYDQSATDIPLLRRKVAKVMDRAGFLPGSHNATRLANILETFPRDELFQIGEDDLLATARDILHLFDRPRVKLFVRADPVRQVRLRPALRSARSLRLKAAGAGGRIARGVLWRPRVGLLIQAFPTRRLRACNSSSA